MLYQTKSSFSVFICYWDVAIYAETSYLVQKKEINISKHLPVRTHIHIINVLIILLQIEFYQVPPTINVPTLYLFWSCLKNKILLQIPQTLLDHVCAHLEQSYILWKESVFCKLKTFSELSQCVVSRDYWEMNFKISVFFSTKNSSLNAACVRRNCLQAGSYSSCVHGLISNNAPQA